MAETGNSPATQKWKQRALKAEQLLETITGRVGEVRAAFSAKIEDLESEKKEFEESYHESKAQNAKLEAALSERDDTIARLCKEIAEEKRLRKVEAEAVGTRAEQIRAWVGTKVAQLEEENARLQDSLKKAGQAASARNSPVPLIACRFGPEHDYEEPPSMYGGQQAAEPTHDYEEPTEEFRMRFGSPDRISPAPPKRWAKPSCVIPPKLIVPRQTALAAPDFRAAEPGRPARPPTPDLALLVSPSPNSLSPNVVRRDMFQYPVGALVEQGGGIRRSRSENDLLSDGGIAASPLAEVRHRKFSQAELSTSQSPPVVSKKPRPLPRRAAHDLFVERKVSSPATLENVLTKQKAMVWPRRRAITDGGLIANPDIDPSVLLYQNVSPEKSSDDYARAGQAVSNPYERVNHAKTDGNGEVVEQPVTPRHNNSNNLYYQLELPIKSPSKPVANSGDANGAQAEDGLGPVSIMSTSSDPQSPTSPGFLQPRSAFTSVNTLSRTNEGWAAGAAHSAAAAAAAAGAADAVTARPHDYSNVDVHGICGEVFADANGDSALPVSSSDSALGTLDKDNTKAETSPPPMTWSPDSAAVPTNGSKSLSKRTPPPVLPKKPKRAAPPIPQVMPKPKSTLAVMSTEITEAPLFETVQTDGTLRVRSTSFVQRPAGVELRVEKERGSSGNEFLSSSEDEKEDNRQEELPGNVDNVTYANTVFGSGMVSQSAPPAAGVMNEFDPVVKRKNIRELVKQHKMSKSIHSEASFADNLVNSSPPIGRANIQAKVLEDGSLDQPVLAKADLENKGYLTKQDSKGKAWKRRWFVLEAGELFYYKLKDDHGKRKPQGRLPLSQLQAVSRGEGLSILISTRSKAYHLTADSSYEAGAWLTVLRNVLQMSISSKSAGVAPYLSRPDCQGWVTRIQDGRAKRCWATLVHHRLFFYLQKDSESPFAELPLEGCRLAVGSNTSSEETVKYRNQLNPPPPEKFTITLYNNAAQDDTAQTSLTVSGKEEKDLWLFHLTVACQGFDETDTERIISMLRDNHHAMLSDFEGDSKVWWKHPVLSYSKKPLTQSLTTLPSEEVRQKALDIFKNIQLFCEVTVEQRGIEYHVAHVQSFLEDIYAQPGLCNEVYCQLIRQCSNHPNPTGVEVHQCWRLLLIYMACGLPKGEKFDWYLQQHIQRHLDFKGGVAVLASSCQRLLHRVKANGPREHLPSRIEIHCLLLGDLAHTKPIMLPVLLMDGNRYAVECDAVSLVQEVTDHLSQRLGLRDTLWSGFALFASRPSSSNHEEYLRPTAKICDAVRRVEMLALQSHQKGRLAPETLWQLNFKNWLYFKGLSNQETDMERRLLLFQIHDNVVKGHFPMGEEFAVDMMAHALQVAQGQCPAGLNSHQRQGALMYGISNFYPKKLLKTATKADIQGLTQRLWVKWDSLRQKSRAECLDAYLRMVRRWPYCSAAFFPCSIRGTSSPPLLLVVQEDRLSFLHKSTLDLDHSYRFDQLLTFGGCEGDLMLVVQHQSGKLSLSRSTTSGESRRETGGTCKVLLHMDPADVTPATLTIASYIKAGEVQQKALEEAATALGL